MNTYDKENITLVCPGCRRKMQLSYRELFSRPEVKCLCGSGYRFDPLTVSRLRSAVSDLERAQKNLERAKQDILKGADTIIKSRR